MEEKLQEETTSKDSLQKEKSSLEQKLKAITEEQNDLTDDHQKVNVNLTIFILSRTYLKNTCVMEFIIWG